MSRRSRTHSRASCITSTTPSGSLRIRICRRGLTRPVVYAAWAAVTFVGASGYLLYRGSHVRTGLALLGLYAALGFYGLAHYAVAPVMAHSLAMNLTIGCEVATAALLAVCVALEARRQFRVSEGSGI